MVMLTVLSTLKVMVPVGWPLASTSCWADTEKLVVWMSLSAMPWAFRAAMMAVILVVLPLTALTASASWVCTPIWAVAVSGAPLAVPEPVTEMVCGWSVGAGGVTVCARAGEAQADSASMPMAASIKMVTGVTERFMVFLLLFLVWCAISCPSWARIAGI